MRLCFLFAIVPMTILAADDPYAAQLFQKHCASCHDSATGAGGRIPQVSVLKTMTPAAIQKTLESGIMKAQATPPKSDWKPPLEPSDSEDSLPPTAHGGISSSP